MTECEEFLANKNPLEKFTDWFQEAKGSNLNHPDAFVLSTVSKDGQPNSRVLLLKEIQSQGLIFYSNYQSQKGQDIENNPKVSLNFYWDPLWRQVCMRGLVSKLNIEDSKKYWSSRPRASQVSQWVSKQSQTVKTREQMDAEVALADREFSGQDVPLPKNWGGYIFTPTYVEFWIGREGRFHDRYAYQKVENTWAGHRLYP